MLTKQELELFNDVRASDSNIKKLIPDWEKYREDSKIDVRDRLLYEADVCHFFSRKALTLEDHLKYFKNQFDIVEKRGVSQNIELIIDADGGDLEIYSKRVSAPENIRVTLERIRKDIQEYKEKKNNLKKALALAKGDKEFLEELVKGVQEIGENQ